MIVKIEINLETLQATVDDETVSVFNVEKNGNTITLEASKPDPEFTESTLLP